VTVVAVGGALASKAGSGGEAWVRLSYALGLRRLGCEVCLIEEAPAASSDAVDYATRAAKQFELEYLPAEEAPPGDLLLNISGNIRSREVRRRFARTAFVDIDPGFTQFWHEQRIEEIPAHDYYLTMGRNIGSADCDIPTCGLDWRPSRPPVVLDEWPVTARGFDRFTTVSTWRSPFGPIEPYGLKHHQWRTFRDLPARTGLEFEAVLDIHPADAADRESLERYGWQLLEPEVTSDPRGFRDYVQGSGAEFSVAQGIYVETGSGWFSDRSTRYLASGRPVLVQDTGFTRSLPAGEGVIAFRTPDEAVAGARSIAENYDRHAAAARAVAEEFFDSDQILAELLEGAL
jgi:hypothetical protein